MLGLQMLTNPVVMRFFGLQIFALVARFCRNFVGKISLSLRLLLYQLSYWCSYNFVIARDFSEQICPIYCTLKLQVLALYCGF